MKDKIIMLIIGFLIGGILTAGGFLIFGKTNTQTPDFEKTKMEGFSENGERPSGMKNKDNSNEIPTQQPSENTVDNTNI